MSPELWQRIPPEAQVIFLEMAATIERLEKRVAELEARLGQTPRNSSRPPSTEHPHAKPPATRTRSGKKRGGQPGHAKAERPLVPPERVDQAVVLKPEACRRCGEGLCGHDPDPRRHQVWELPEIQPLITEYQLHRLTCPHCHTATSAELPTGVPHGQSGPRLIAFVALLMAYFRQSKSRVSLFCETVLHLPCSTGLTVKLQNIATSALRPAYDELVAALPDEAVLGIDESPTKEATHKAWLWDFVAQDYTVFTLRTTRSGEVLDELLPAERFQGIVTCDRAKMYWRLPTLQWCWAHLKRNFQALADSSHEIAQEIGTGLVELTKRLFRQWSRCRDGTISRRGLKISVGNVRHEVEEWLLRGLRSTHARTAEVCRELYWYRERLWTFLEAEQVEPTNNASERALRHAVIWRKLSFGTQSAAGSRFVETLLTIIETCRQQGRDLFAYVTNSVESHLNHQAPNSLLVGL
jgi:transposase